MHTQACQTQCMQYISKWPHEVSVLPLRILFPDTAKESSFHLLSSGLPWVSQLTTYTAAGQVDSWTKLPGRPRLEPVPQVSPNALYSQGTQRNSKVRTTALNGRRKKMVGRYDDWNWKPLARHQGSWNPNLLISSAQLLLLWIYSQ